MYREQKGNGIWLRNLEFVTQSTFKTADMYAQFGRELKSAPVPKGMSDADTSMYKNLIAPQPSLIHISEPTRILSNSYAVLRLKKKNEDQIDTHHHYTHHQAHETRKQHDDHHQNQQKNPDTYTHLRHH